MRRGELVAVELEGAGKLQHWTRPEMLDAGPGPADDLVHILSPFDPLVLQRKRLQLFFGYEHRFEAYVPEGQAGVRLLRAAGAGRRRDRRRHRPQDRPRAGQAAGATMDLDRRRQRKSHKRLIEEALHRFERFQLAR